FESRSRSWCALLLPPAHCAAWLRDTDIRTSLESPLDHGVDLGLNEPVRVYEATHLHDRVDRPDVAEELAVHLGDGLPVLNPREQDARPDDVLDAGPELLKGRNRDLETPPRLVGWIAPAHRLSVGAEWCGAGNRDEI